MKRLIQIGLLIWFFLLFGQVNIAAASNRLYTADFDRIFTYNSGNQTVAVDSQEGSNSNTGSATDKNAVSPGPNQNTENETPTPTPATEAVKPSPKLSVAAPKDTQGVKSNTDVKASPTVSIPKTVNEAPVQSTADTEENKLKMENILLSIWSWWLANPLSLQIWYLFFLAALVLYFFQLKQFRRPLLFFSIIILGFYLGNSLDPISAIFNIIPKTGFTFDLALILAGLAVLLSIFLGRFYCGWLCPLGAVQELIHPGAKVGMPSALDALLKYLKYPVLVVFLYLAWRTGENLWSSYEPLKVLVHFNGSSLAILVLILTLMVSVLIERPFCRYICPLGAILALTSRLAFFRMRTDAVACMVCGKCTSGDCPMNAIEAYNTITDLPEINNAECIYCLNCQKICQRSALRVTVRRIDRVQNLGN